MGPWKWTTQPTITPLTSFFSLIKSYPLFFFLQITLQLHLIVRGLLQCSPIVQSVYPCISILLLGHVEKIPVLSGLMLPLCRSFLSNCSEAESLSTERIPNQIPFYSCLPELLTRNRTALQHTNIAHILLSHFSLLLSSLSRSLSQLPLLLHPPPILTQPSLIYPFFNPSTPLSLV